MSMAAGKKKKKPASNPARGFATTSLPSKPRIESLESVPAPEHDNAIDASNEERDSKFASHLAHGSSGTVISHELQSLSPEEFERQLEENELQGIVDKHAIKAKRDAARQVARLHTDRRLLRGQAETLITRKWLPPDLIDEILNVITVDNRPDQPPVEATPLQKPPTEEDLIIRLWVLQQTLNGAGFPDERVDQAIAYILSISEKVGNATKDTVWGLEESLEWLARDASKFELPDYENHSRKKLVAESPIDTPPTSGTTTPHLTTDLRQTSGIGLPMTPRDPVVGKPDKVKRVIEYESDIEPEDLLPVYLRTKAEIFHLLPATVKSSSVGRRSARDKHVKSSDADTSPVITKLQRKLKRIEGDILFDQYVADQRWEQERIILEREAAAKRIARPTVAAEDKQGNVAQSDDDSAEDEISRQAAEMAAEILEEGSDDDAAIADLFASLPITEVDAVTGKSCTVMKGADGIKVSIRDFGKTTGMSPKRVLEEACRARDTSVKFQYVLVSSASFSNRHSLRISWSKSQDNLPAKSPFPELECLSTPKSTSLTMMSVSCPDAVQSESYVATAALYLIFGASVREEKVFLRLPANWRELWTEFATITKEQSDLSDRDAIRGFRDMIRQKRDREDEDGVVLTTAFKRRTALITPNDTSDESGPDKSKKDTRSPEALQMIWREKAGTPAFQAMLPSRMQLPMWGFRDEVLRTVDENQVVIICGETGCGKSTQVPSFILEHQLAQGKPCKIYCTEPRRISAISLAKRVSEELGERKNDLGTSRSLVGYAIRLESNTTKETRLVYATTGIVMRMLEGSNDLREVTHIVLDEVHERTIDSDFLLIILKKLMARRPDLKIVLMSATVDADRFSRYLDGAPVLQVPGRTFPVKCMFLEDAVELTGFTVDGGETSKHYTDQDDELESVDLVTNPETKAEEIKALKGYSSRTRNTISLLDEYRIEYDLIMQLIATIACDERYIDFSKAILVFLPGIGEIRQLNDMLVGHPLLGSNWFIYPLHSTIASEDQEAAFLVPPPGTRKIVLATNIAETGITIPDVTCVIDTGKHREMRFDERRQLSRLLETFISKANAKQRRGRAGRVQEGLCFHMFTRYRHDRLMADQQTPELLRLSLQDLAIRVKICKLGGIEETLGQALDPPSAKNVRRAIDALIDVRALTAGEDLTPLGQQLARLPLDVFLGKLILLGSIFKCLDAAITIAAILSSKSPFSAPFGARSQADTIRLAFRRGDSDLLTVYNAYLAWKKVCNTSGSEYQFCRKNFLSVQTLSNIEDLKGQLVVCLVDAGFLPLTEVERSNLNKSRFQSRRRQFFDLPQRANVNSDNDLITGSVIAWSFYPKLLIKDGKGWRNVANNQNISLHPSSVNKGRSELNWLSYYHIMQAKAFYNAHETTAVQDFAIALLCGDVKIDMYAGVITLDGNRARFAISDWKTMLVIKTLRSKLREIMTKSFRNPGKPLSAQQMKWLDIWQRIFSQEELLQAKGYSRETSV